MTVILNTSELAAGWHGNKLIENLDLNLSFDQHEQCLPIVGRTGLGKSTLLYVLAGMAVPVAGRVTWILPEDDGTGSPHPRCVSWSGESREAFRPSAEPRPAKFGFLLQDAAMLPCFTVEENMRHSMRLRGLRLKRSEAIERIRAVIASMAIDGEDVDKLRHVYPGNLSGGQRQRMALATATVHEPSVLFADEPTASLDEETGLQVLRAVRQWLDASPTRQRCFVFVTHSLGIIRDGLRVDRMLRLRKNHAETGAQLAFSWEATH